MNKKFLLFLLIINIFFIGCKSLKQPVEIQTPLDYTKEDVKNNEIKQILKILENNPLKALWRSFFLNDLETTKKCEERVLELLNLKIEVKDYFEADKILKSLMAYGYKDVDDLAKKVVKPKLPGSEIDKRKLPKTISDCVNATVTVWVDKGIKVQNGAGFPDVTLGSGFFIDKQGYIVTNHHVIEDCVNPKNESFSRLYIKLSGDMETKIPAKIIGYDSVLDLALLKVEIEPEFVFDLGSSSDLHIGDKISVIGTPIGLDGTLTSGIISNVDRRLTTLGNVFQIDAAVNSGNSGGPLIDSNFRVQAIVFAGMLQFQGLNFAIPIEYLKQELPLLYNGGEITHSWIGAYGHTYKIKNIKSGLEIQYVLPGGSAQFAGIQEGDIIKQINGMKINSLEDFHFASISMINESIVSCSYLRDDKEYSTILYLEKKPKSPAVNFYSSDVISDSFIPIFGIKLIPASTSNKKSYRIEKVIKGSIADDLSLSENDPITVYDVKVDNQNNIIIAKIFVQRKSKGFLDVSMIITASFDSPYYF